MSIKIKGTIHHKNIASEYENQKIPCWLINFSINGEIKAVEEFLHQISDEWIITAISITGKPKTIKEFMKLIATMNMV